MLTSVNISPVEKFKGNEDGEVLIGKSRVSGVKG
jgi:hypothetical protein